MITSLNAGPDYVEEILRSGKEIVIFTHNDLDAIVSMLNVEFKFPDIKKKYFHTNYANIDVRVEEIKDYVKENNIEHILIPDVSFSDNKESLRVLYSLAKCTHLDHHLYPEGFWDEFPEMRVVWDKSKCAAKICNEYFDNKGKNKNLDKLTFICDVYDLWQTKSPAFKIAQDMNEYFWQNNIGTLCNTFVKNNYELPGDYMQVVDKQRALFKAALVDYEKRKLIYRGGEITVAFVNDFFNQILIKEMDEGQNFVVGVNSYGIVRVRVKAESPYSLSQLDNMRLRMTGTKDIGHAHAWTFKIKETPTFNRIMIEIQSLVKIIQEECSK